MGLSDHSGSVSPALFALGQGYNVIEIHATFDRRMFGPDVKSSLTLEEIKNIVNFAKDVDFMRSNPVDKNKIAEDLSEQKRLFGRSLTYSSDLNKGHILKKEDLLLKKPGTGVPLEEITNLIGKKLKNDVKINRLLKLSEIE